MKLLFASWGNPKEWKEHIYVFGTREITSNSSLKILQEVIQPDKIIIIGLDTLAESGLDYKEVQESAKKKIERYAREFGLENCEVLIGPGVGTFPNGKFEGSALDYYYYILAQTSINLLKYSDESLDIHLDLTHGINYSTILTYRAIKEIIELFAIFKKVKFKAYNTDPFSSVASKLFVNIIEDAQPTPKPFNNKIKANKPILPLGENWQPDERRKLFEEDLSCIRSMNPKEISAFIGALYNGLPLALFRFYPDKEKLKGIIEKCIEVFENYIVVNPENLNVKRRVSFSEDFKVYVFAYLIAEFLNKSGLLNRPEKEVSLSRIKTLKSKLFNFDRRLEIRIDNDIWKLSEVENNASDEWEIYNKIFQRTVGEPDSRNFLAHSGFERNIVEVKKNGRGLMLRYIEEGIDTIMDFSCEGLK